jgi:shikimate dehydrogenase
MKQYGLIGYPLGHSFSAAWFAQLFAAEGITDAVYDNFPLAAIDELPALLATHPDLHGFNVTIPYKEAILPYLTELDPQAAAIGAVNCVKVIRWDNELILKGFNTDSYGFERSLLALIGDSRPSALVLGTGGASRAVGYVLDCLSIPFRKVSRRAEGQVLSYDELTEETIARSPLIVNTSPVGRSPHTDEMPRIPYSAIGRSHFLYDLIYNPAQTAFLREGRRRGAAVMNGYAMLVAQAQRSWEIWQEDTTV